MSADNDVCVRIDESTGTTVLPENMILGCYPLSQDNNPESIKRELKEVPHVGSVLGRDESTLKEFVDSGNYEQLITDGTSMIGRVLRKYLAKYFSSFLNTLNLLFGEMIFGLNDYGRCTGVMVPPSLTSDKIREIVIDIIRENIVEYHANEKIKSILQEMCDKITINVVPVDTENHYLESNYDQKFAYYNGKLDVYTKNEIEHAEKSRAFVEKIESYKRSIALTLADPVAVADIIKFCGYHNPIEHDSDLEMVRSSVIEQLEMLNRGEIKIEYEQGQFSREKNDYHYVTYWISEYRSHMVGLMQKERPITNNRITKPRPYRNALIGNTLQRIIEYDTSGKEFEVCVIQIIMPGGKQLEGLVDSKVYYEHCGSPRATKRKFSKDGEPCCA
jgi:hypothetical protein